MQSLDRILSAPSGRGELKAAPEKDHGHAAADDFGHLMQRALAAKPKDSSRDIALRSERKPAPSVNNSPSPENEPVATVGKNISRKASTKTATQNPAAPNATAAADTLWAGNDLSDSIPPLELLLPPSVRLVAPPTVMDFAAAAKVDFSPAVMPAKADAGGVASIPKEIPKVAATAEAKPPSLAAELAPSNDHADATAPKAGPVNTETAVEPDALSNRAALAEPFKALTAGLPKANELAAAAVRAPEIGGTGVATVELPMKKNANTNKVAGLDGKVLPGDAALSACAKVLPAPALPGPARLADNNSSEASINLTLPDSFGSVELSAAQTLAILPSLTDARMRNLERTHDMVALHAVRLVEAQTSTLSVVIKPGAGTELSLELRQGDGGIEAHAVLARGDFQLMNQHWSELQQRLEQRGIKLAPLGGEATSSTDSGGNFNQQQQHASRELEAQKASAFAEFALAGRNLGATARLALGGWESWA